MTRSCLQVHVNIADKLKTVDLASLQQTCWPAGAAVDNLASKAAQLVTKGVAFPYILVDLRDFLPYWASDGQEDESEGPRPPA